MADGAEADRGLEGDDMRTQTMLSIFLLLTAATYAVTGLSFRGHLSKLGFPALQINVLRILAVCPVFATLLWTTLAAPQAQIFVEAALAMYEGYVLYCFFGIMVIAVGGEEAAVSVIAQRGPPYHLFCCSRSCVLARLKTAEQLYHTYRHGVVQMIFVKPVIITVVGILHAAGVRHFYGLRLLVPISLIFALKCLIQSYIIFKPHSTNINVEWKFIVVKLLVAILVIQQAVINVVFGVRTGSAAEQESFRENGHRIYAFITICELLVYSIVLWRVFRPEIFERMEARQEHPNGRTKNVLLKTLRFWRVIHPVDGTEMSLALHAVLKEAQMVTIEEAAEETSDAGTSPV